MSVTNQKISRVIYISRHGEAEGLGIRKDGDRQLTDSGRKGVLIVAEHMKTRGPKPEIILTSPLRRAQQTSEIFSKSFNATIEQLKILSPGASPPQLFQVLQNFSSNPILLVGHMPDVGNFALFVIGGMTDEESGGQKSISFLPGAIAKVDYQVSDKGLPHGKIDWTISPQSLLRKKSEK